VMEDALTMIAMLQLHDKSAGHGSQAMVSTGDLNFATGKRETPPSNHYLLAARRLQLTSRQVQHLRLMHRQFNRMAQQQNQAGQQLVALSNNSFSLLTTTAGRMSQASSLQQDRSSTGVSGSALQQPRSQEADASGMLAAANTQSRTGSGSGSSRSRSGIPALIEQEEAGSGAEALEELLLKHVDNELDLLTVSKPGNYRLLKGFQTVCGSEHVFAAVTVPNCGCETISMQRTIYFVWPPVE